MHRRLRDLAPEHAASDGATALADWVKHHSGPPVRHTVTREGELQRILDLPRRAPLNLDPQHPTTRAMVRLMGGRLKRQRTYPCACAEHGWSCVTDLLPAQAWALYEASIVGGLLAPIGVGHGKTALNILLALVIAGVRLAVLLIPPGLRVQLQQEYLRWREHWLVPSIRMGEWGHIVPGQPVLHVVPYSVFSRPESTQLLESLDPDLVIGDEAHSLSNRAAARTRRLFRRFEKRPDTRACFYSGSLFANSIKDAAHLGALALKTGSPLPIDPEITEKWASVLDPSETPTSPGALKVFMENGDLIKGFHRRLVETPGIVATTSGAINASINLIEHRVKKVPNKILQVIHEVRESGVRPDGEVFKDQLLLIACLQQLACGFYYRWKFPKGEPKELIDEWFERRKDWFRELRAVLQRNIPHMDSEHLAEHAAIRAHSGRSKDGLPNWPALTWPAWFEIRHEVSPVPEAVWIDDFLVKDASEWGHKNRGIIWSARRAFCIRLAKESGLPVHLGGPNSEREILAETGKTSIIASIKAHGTGRDGLQYIFNEQLVTTPPGSGKEWEQLLGRLHRIGQKAPEVNTEVCRHTPELAESIDKAIRKAKFIDGLTGANQKLLSCTPDFAF